MLIEAVRQRTSASPGFSEPKPAAGAGASVTEATPDQALRALTGRVTIDRPHNGIRVRRPPCEGGWEFTQPGLGQGVGVS
ncbi:hypothetical protein ACE1SV_65990 [Streptomyces sennicomposti]